MKEDRFLLCNRVHLDYGTGPNYQRWDLEDRFAIHPYLLMVRHLDFRSNSRQLHHRISDELSFP